MRTLPRRGHVIALLVVAAVALAVLQAVRARTAEATTSETVALPASGAVTVTYRGAGHGQGMSQYGARGAALAGLTAAQITAFYYPNTTLVTLPASTVRVNLSGLLPNTTVVAAPGGLSLTAAGTTQALPSDGVDRYRLVPDGAGLQLQRQVSGSAGWQPVQSGLPAQADFSSTVGYVRVVRADQGMTDYRGSVGALRSGSGELTISRVGLDDYTMGVVPREMPVSWPSAALQAQAIAARSYARSAVERSGSASYDICDTNSCQVYGGMRRLNASGTVQWTDDPDVVTGNANQVLQYQGATIFASYGASNGGWSVDGGKPYLPAQQDPYDNAASQDPYLDATRSVPVSSIASRYGLARATAIEITGRDGHGTWGGRVTSAYVDGVDAGGAAQRVATTGAALQSALGLQTSWFRIGPDLPPAATAPPIGHLDVFQPSETGRMQVLGWSFDPDHPGQPGRVQLRIDGVVQSVVTTSVPRPDVVRAYPALAPTASGVAITVWPTPGEHTACLYGVDADGLGENLLECRTATMPAARGVLDSADGADGAGLHLVGWAYDVTQPASPGRVQVSFDGVASAPVATSVARPDVQRAYQTPADQYGFDLTLAVPPRTRTACVSALDAAGKSSFLLGCVPVQRPVGHLDVFDVSGGGRMQVLGWSFDPDHPGEPGRVELRVDGVVQSVVTTSTARPDVVRAYPASAPAASGIAMTVPAAPGPHTACLYGVDADGLGENLLECRTATMPAARGVLDTVEGAGTDGIRLVGWSFDTAQPAGPGRVQVSIDGVPSAPVTTSVARPDVQRVYQTPADQYGFDLTVRVPARSHTVCVYGVDADGKASLLLECVPAQRPIGHLDVFQPSQTGRMQVLGWSFDPDHPGQPGRVELRIDGVVQSAVTTSAARPDVVRAYPASAPAASGIAMTVPVDPGTHTACLYGVDADGLGENLLGCRTATMPVSDPATLLDK